jgi:ribosomal protein S12 methylthiotransferase accessory factor
VARHDRPAVVVGLGADVDWRVAATKATLEVGQVRPALRARLRDPETQTHLADLLADPQAVRDLEDHDLLYADPSQLGQLSHWLAAPEAPAPADIVSLGIAVVRVLVAGLVPIHFGADETRLGVDRLWTYRSPAGDTARDLGELNLVPHPLA